MMISRRSLDACTPLTPQQGGIIAPKPLTTASSGPNRTRSLHGPTTQMCYKLSLLEALAPGPIHLIQQPF